MIFLFLNIFFQREIQDLKVSLRSFACRGSHKDESTCSLVRGGGGQGGGCYSLVLVEAFLMTIFSGSGYSYFMVYITGYSSSFLG